MKKVIILLHIFLFMGALASANEVKSLTMDAFIRTAAEDYTLKNQKELNIYLENAPESTRYVDRIELRTKTEDFELEKQKYSMRFYPKGWGETKYSGMVNDALKSTGETDYKDCYNKSLRNRYETVLDYLETLEMISVKKRQAAVCKDMVTVLKKKSVSSVSFEIRDLIAAEEFLTELKLALVKLRNNRAGILHTINLTVNSEVPVAFDRKRLVSVNDIFKLKKNIAINDNESINLLSMKNKVNLARNKYRLEKSKTRDYLSFFQVTYDTDEADDPQKAYSVEFGIKLPFINSDQDDVNRKKLSYLQEKLKLEGERRAFSEKVTCLERSLERMITQYAMLVDTNKNGSARSSYTTYLKMDGVDPLTILKIKESILKNEIQRIETGYDIRKRYIDLLYTSGKLAQKPFTNYLEKKGRAK